MKKLYIILGFLLFTVTSSGDDSVFFIVRMEPSVMLILDTSSSMTQWFTADGGHFEDKTWGDGSVDYPGMDMDGDGFPNDSRLYALKEAVRHVVETWTTYRFGIMTYQQDYWWGIDGLDWYRSYPYGADDAQNVWWHGNKGYGDVKVHIGDPTLEHRDSILIWMDHQCNFDDITQGDHEIRADGNTPLAGALQAAQDEFAIQEIPNDPARECRHYFVVIVTDGRETFGGNPPGKAKKLRRTVVDGVEYDIQTYVIATSPSRQDLTSCNSIARNGGTQAAHDVYTPAQFDSAFAFIMGDIEHRSFAFSAPEVPAVRSKYYDKLYMGSFIPDYDAFWRGFLKCYQLADDGTLPVDSMGIPLEYPLWEAGAILRSKASSSRNIYTEMNGDLVSFTSEHVSADDLGVDPDSVASLISWVRGDNDRDWKLGDIYHSWPIVVGPPSPFYYDKGYDQFLQNNKHRDKTIFVGTNGGVLQAFEAGSYVTDLDKYTDGTGQEVWAFIPHDLLGRLKDMKRTHGYYVDGSPQVADVWLPSGDDDTTRDANEWRTVLICGERQGGNYYFALDVTDTRNPTFLWSFMDEHSAQSWSQPAIGKVKLSAGGGYEIDRWVAVFGGGFSKDSVGTKGMALYILDIRNGTKIREFSSASMTHCFPSAPRLVDTDGDNFVDKIYIGDIGGRLWRYDVSSTTPGQWTSDIIFTAPQGNPIYYPPSVCYDDFRNLWVFFGTGDRDRPRDTTYENRFYGLIDHGQSVPYTETDLGNVTTGGEPTDKGWYIKFVEQPENHKAEKCISSCEVFGGIVYFTTYQPLFEDPCAVIGIARYYQVKYTTGLAVEGERSEEIGISLPTPPQITVSQQGNFVITVSTSREKIITKTLKRPSAFKKITYWRDIIGGY